MFLCETLFLLFHDVIVRKRNLYLRISKKAVPLQRNLKNDYHMTNEIASYNLNEEGVVIYQTDDNTLQLDVQVAEETVWLTQQQMASLFNSTIPNISMHIRNIYKEGELEKGATVKDFLIVQNEGGRQVTRHVSYYNLDVYQDCSQTCYNHRRVCGCCYIRNARRSCKRGEG